MRTRLYTCIHSIQRIAMHRIYATLLLMACALLASCGNKGPLVLPDQKPTQPDKSAIQDAAKHP